MKTLEIDLATAKKLYPSASDELKSLLEKTFSVKVLNDKITDIIKSFQDVLEAKGMISLPAVPGEQKDETTYRQLKLIAEVLNEGWIADYSNEDQYKYYPYFQYNKKASAFRFYSARYNSSAADTGSGVRLCFRNSELAEYAGKQFIDIYNNILNF